MIAQSIERLSHLCEIIPLLLFAMDEQEFSRVTAPGKWSKKQILGHLIDSAANNHHRFVRGQFEHLPRISYDADAWNEHGYYNQMESPRLISFWALYNKQLLALIRLIPEEKLQRQVDTGGPAPHTLAFLIADYVAHMEHHLRQIIAYE
jgi:hypothetical protein